MTHRLSPGTSVEVRFASFTVRLDLRPASQMRLEIVAGDNEGFADDAPYELHWVRDDVAMLSFQERIGTTVTHVIDLAASRSYATVTPASGGFLRLVGDVRLSTV